MKTLADFPTGAPYSCDPLQFARNYIEAIQKWKSEFEDDLKALKAEYEELSNQKVACKNPEYYQMIHKHRADVVDMVLGFQSVVDVPITKGKAP